MIFTHTQYIIKIYHHIAKDCFIEPIDKIWTSVLHATSLLFSGWMSLNFCKDDFFSQPFRVYKMKVYLRTTSYKPHDRFHINLMLKSLYNYSNISTNSREQLTELMDSCYYKIKNFPIVKLCPIVALARVLRKLHINDMTRRKHKASKILSFFPLIS